jgi:hypothetical protein
MKHIRRSALVKMFNFVREGSDVEKNGRIVDFAVKFVIGKSVEHAKSFGKVDDRYMLSSTYPAPNWEKFYGIAK